MAHNEHRLPDTVRPVSYALTLEPDLVAGTFRGEVQIEIEVLKPASEIVLHASDLQITEATIAGATAPFRLEPEKERIVLSAGRNLPPGKSSIALKFSAELSEKMRGFYRSGYTLPDGTKRFMATTQFESTSARRAFPCFDEPALKATFDVTLIVPKDRVAVSNMPEISEQPVEGGKRRIRYARSPVMSTYLLAFAVGEFSWIEGKTKDGLPVRVYTTPGRSALGQFALDTAIRGLEFFGKYYGIPYETALPKLDLLAIPDFEFGAMENWGAITFRETAIFVDPEKSSIPQRRRVAEVVLHELAHQWFGNLVTPEWWSFLWLNESFATFMAYKAADALFPDWRVWEDYLSDITTAGKSLDSLRSSHPVEVIVRDPNEVDQIFDAISYNKGGSVLRMLEQAIGEEAFRLGVARYLQRHAYACATTDDLWRAVGDGAGMDVPAMMDGWTRQTGMPVVTLSRKPPGVLLRQERFFLDRDPDRPASDKTLWDIPVSLLDASGTRTIVRLSQAAADLTTPWLKANAGQAGFYLVNYDHEGWEALAKAVESMSLSALDRFGLQEDAYSLMRAGYLPVPVYLGMAGAFSNEDNHHVWAGVAEGMAALADIFSGDPNVPRLEEFARKLLRPVAQKVGWDERPDEPADRVLLRATALSASVRFGAEDAVSQVKARFAAARKNLGALAPNLRSMVLSGAARHGADEVLDHLVELYEKADLPEVKVQLLRATGAFRREAPLRRAVAYALSDQVRRQDLVYVFAGIPIETKPVAWALLQEHWAVIDERYGKSGMIGHIIASACSGIPREEHAAEVEAFFRKHPAPFATEKIKQTLEGIRARARFRVRNQGALAKFFGA